MRRTVFDRTHQAFREMVRTLFAREVVPYAERWEEDGVVPRTLYDTLGAAGLLGIRIPAEFGGGGERSFRYNAVITEEIAAGSVFLGTVNLHMNVVIPYFLHHATAEQQARWLPGLASGATMGAIAMTEPGSGSDLAGLSTTAVRDGDHYLLNGAKTFITGGTHAGLVIVVARTARTENRRDGLTLLVVEDGMTGFTRGRPLRKLGLHAQDTTELSFADVRVPVSHVLGEEGRAFGYLGSNLPQERLSIAVGSQAMSEAMIAETVQYVTARTVFGTSLASFQNTKFTLAALAAQVEAGRQLVDRAIEEFDAGTLDPADAAKAKLYTTELQGQVADQCLQLHGGYGYMREYPIARRYADARVSRIYGGSSEIMKSIIAKSLGL
ncbi:acyl-CoA dehydrogenase family protein [Peterkaempfera bronchialis]|uniref:Acyl-CoA dehydrogenase n=1 Tax=Peterkaempfera bronchialis TaxID=2126346 RepID=A0A345T3C8_9ACTN|nr:acyl-CoA dehydrogenase family protein [Peterkaempfera bronchialis]AXI80483.1 acyl-CoA dehydrogenase [Peterkaempfera bronchialis]